MTLVQPDYEVVISPFMAFAALSDWIPSHAVAWWARTICEFLGVLGSLMRSVGGGAILGACSQNFAEALRQRRNGKNAD